jgi:hypothetical protein
MGAAWHGMCELAFNLRLISYMYFMNFSPVTLPGLISKYCHQTPGGFTNLNVGVPRNGTGGRRRHFTELSLMEEEII